MGLVLSCKWHGRITVDLYTALMLYLLVTFPLVMFELPMAIMIQSSYNYFINVQLLYTLLVLPLSNWCKCIVAMNFIDKAAAK